MLSFRRFLGLWVLITAIILGYAAIDLYLHPSLRTEAAMTMRPDWTKIADLIHWGGRLLKEGALGLLLGNAVVMGGMLALTIHSVLKLVRRRRGSRRAQRERVSVFPSNQTGSLPPSN